MNSFSFSGNLGKDAEIREMNGEVVCNFSVANKVRRKKEDRVQWISCSMWGRRAEGVQKYLKKGTKVFCTGSLLLESWTNKSGEEKPILRCIITDIEFVSSKQKEEEPEVLYNNDSYYAKDDVNF